MRFETFAVTKSCDDQHMPSWLPLVVAAVLAVLTVWANVVVNTTIKFAPDAATAKAELKQIGSTVLRRTLNVVMVIQVAASVFMPGPITGVRVLTICMCFAALTYALTSSMLMRVSEALFKQILNLYDLHGRAADLQQHIVTHLQDEQSKHIELTGRVVNGQVAIAEKLSTAPSPPSQVKR